MFFNEIAILDIGTPASAPSHFRVVRVPGCRFDMRVRTSDGGIVISGEGHGMKVRVGVLHPLNGCIDEAEIEPGQAAAVGGHFVVTYIRLSKPLTPATHPTNN
ncbi:MAG: hypothetical protein WCV84_04030 [Patescibacteria group bacterium]